MSLDYGNTIRTSFGILFVGIAFSSHPARADKVLLSAPSSNFSYYGMYCNTCEAVSFTLSATYNLSTIDVVLRTPAETSFTTFDFSLQSSLTGSFTTYASAFLTAPLGGPSTEAMTVDTILSPSTYYLVGNVPGYAGTTVTPGDVDGWYLSTGVYSGTAGTITNGQWGGPPSWTLFSGDYYGNGVIYTAAAFTVNGSPVSSAVPESSTWVMLIVGFAGLGFAGYRGSHNGAALTA